MTYRVSDLLADARSLNKAFKYPSEPVFLPSGLLDPNAPRNEALLEHKALLRAYYITLAKIPRNDADMTQHWRTAKRELEHFMEICERWIRTSSTVFLGRIRGTTPAITRTHGPAAHVAVQHAAVPERSRTEPDAKLQTLGSHKRKRDALEVSLTVAQAFITPRYR